MESEVIFEKKYPRVDYLAQCELAKAEIAENPNKEKLSHDEIMERIYGGLTYTLIPERIKKSEKFIREAIKISRLYELDIKILQHIDHISVDLSFDCGGAIHYINRLFGMADQFFFFKDLHDRDLTICLDFYTHTATKDGRIFSP